MLADTGSFKKTEPDLAANTPGDRWIPRFTQDLKAQGWSTESQKGPGTWRLRMEGRVAAPGATSFIGSNNLSKNQQEITTVPNSGGKAVYYTPPKPSPAVPGTTPAAATPTADPAASAAPAADPAASAVPAAAPASAAVPTPVPAAAPAPPPPTPSSDASN